MNARLIKFWQDLQESYYFIPGLMAVSAMILALITAEMDRHLDWEMARNLGWFYSNKADGARAILTTIASSMMTVAAVTFSITMVAVTSAAGQYGPRLIGNFMRDRANQFTLGTFTSTFIYCLLILRVARTGDGGSAEDAITEFVPNLSLLVAIGMTLASVAVMIYFIHHIPETLNVANITSQVGKKMRGDMDERFPHGMGKGLDPAKVDLDWYEFSKAAKVPARAEGYIQTFQMNEAMKLAVKNDWVLRVQYRPGDFVTYDDTLLYIWSETDISDAQLRSLRELFAMGRERTAYQNVLFLADELVEILGRALSPGINDPYTAINCINWYQSGCKAMLRAETPSPFRADDAGVLRVIAFPVDFKRLANVLFGRSRPYVAPDLNVTTRMMTCLTELILDAKRAEDKAVLQTHLEHLMDSAQSLCQSEPDQKLLAKRLSLAKRVISDSDIAMRHLNSQDWMGGRG